MLSLRCALIEHWSQYAACVVLPPAAGSVEPIEETCDESLVMRTVLDPELEHLHEDIQRALLQGVNVSDISRMIRRRTAPKVCSFYQKGACKYGISCKYSHAEVDNNRQSHVADVSSTLASLPTWKGCMVEEANDPKALFKSLWEPFKRSLQPLKAF